jgi:hypothetical protein
MIGRRRGVGSVRSVSLEFAKLVMWRTEIMTPRARAANAHPAFFGGTLPRPAHYTYE